MLRFISHSPSIAYLSLFYKRSTGKVAHPEFRSGRSEIHPKVLTTSNPQVKLAQCLWEGSPLLTLHSLRMTHSWSRPSCTDCSCDSSSLRTQHCDLMPPHGRCSDGKDRELPFLPAAKQEWHKKISAQVNPMEGQHTLQLITSFEHHVSVLLDTLPGRSLYFQDGQKASLRQSCSGYSDDLILPQNKKKSVHYFLAVDVHPLVASTTCNTYSPVPSKYSSPEHRTLQAMLHPSV